MASGTSIKKVLFVGADHLGSFPRKLEAEGINEIIHWNGRNNSTQNKYIPIDVGLIFLNPGFVNHGLMHMVKKQAKSRGIPLVFGKYRLLSDNCYPEIARCISTGN